MEGEKQEKSHCLQILIKAKEVLQKNIWIKGALALDEDDNNVSSYSDSACQFCMTGALKRAYMTMAFPNDESVDENARSYADLFLNGIEFSELKTQRIAQKVYLLARNAVVEIIRQQNIVGDSKMWGSETNFGIMANYNDFVAKSRDDIIHVLDKAINFIEEGGQLNADI